nr:hypothetical protein [Tanacetum cinerariifolium]
FESSFVHSFLEGQNAWTSIMFSEKYYSGSDVMSSSLGDNSYDWFFTEWEALQHQLLTSVFTGKNKAVWTAGIWHKHGTWTSEKLREMKSQRKHYMS